MIINKIKLDNIRSYISQEVNFDKGSVLLWGDVGCGKSTLLLAIDFALFGLQRGTLDGNALLRNGTDNGSVEVELNIEDKKVYLKRGLKRTKNGIVQDTGYIIVNGEKKDASAIELKQAILDLLNYPKNLLTKSKSLLYRYTVYTPQEEMKAILFGDNETRVDILRKIFGVDKYKLVKENSKIYSSKLRERMKIIEVTVADLENKKIELENLNNKIQEKNSIKNNIELEFNNATEKTKISEKILQKNEEKIKESDNIKHEIQVNENTLKYKVEERKKIFENLERLEKEKVNYENELSKELKIDEEELIKVIDNKKEEIRNLENEFNKFNYEVQKAELNIKRLEKDKDDVVKLDKCPSCKQNVTEEYKGKFVSEIDTNLNEFISEKNVNSEKTKSCLIEINKFKEELEKLHDNKRLLDVLKVKKENLRNIIERIIEINKNNELIKELIADVNVKNSELYKRLDLFKHVQNEYLRNKEIFNQDRENEKLLHIEKEKINVEINNFRSLKEKLDLEIKKGLEKREKIAHYSKIKEWMDNKFISLIDDIEKQVMLRVYYDFNELFVNWFSMIMDNEAISVRLDFEFKPVIQQNGYDIDFVNLSGGEKTAAALAYRLALNQVINKLVGIIKTKDLLILDEPTDGFSDEQLDRIGNVFEQLDMGQLIIVSHENKIESFVEKVIKFDKKNHVSHIIS